MCRLRCMDAAQAAAANNGAGAMQETDARRIIREVMSALKFIHSKGFAYLCVRPEEIVFATDAPDAPIKLIDFDQTTMIGQNVHHFGTVAHTPPEMMNTVDSHVKIDAHTSMDMWMVGVTLYVMLAGTQPFFGKDDDDHAGTLTRIKEGSYHFYPHIWKEGGKSDASKDLIQSLLKATPSERPTLEQVLAHKWVTG